MPFTHIVSLIGVLAITGIPIFAGFFSKDGILASAFAQNTPLYLIGLFVALLTAFYMGRWYFLVWRGQYRGDTHLHPHDGDALLSAPLGILAALATVGGFLNVPTFLFGGNHALDNFLGRAIPVEAHEIPVSTEWITTFIAVGMAVIGLAWAYYDHRRQALQVGPLGETSLQALYLDRLYTAVVGNGSKAIARGLDSVDNGVDGGHDGHCHQRRRSRLARHPLAKRLCAGLRPEHALGYGADRGLLGLAGDWGRTMSDFIWTQYAVRGARMLTAPSHCLQTNGFKKVNCTNSSFSYRALRTAPRLSSEGASL